MRFLCLLLLILLGVNLPAAAESGWDLFGSSENRRLDLSPFHKWTAVLARLEEERQQPDCPLPLAALCEDTAFQSLIEQQLGQERSVQIKAVNQFMNDRRYILDPVNWGLDDYWATPSQFLAYNGDCEDYAIAKMTALKLLGWDNQSMRIVVLKDLNLNIAHAVLAVQLDGETYILDNQVAQVMDHRQILHYQPIFSINEEAWWLHQPA